MGFKRLVSLVCDGPCGTVLPDSAHAPVGWAKLLLNVYERLQAGQKPSVPLRYAYFCPACHEKFVAHMTRGKFAINIKSKDSVVA